MIFIVHEIYYIKLFILYCFIYTLGGQQPTNNNWGSGVRVSVTRVE